MTPHSKALPPDVARYLADAPQEASQFGFLIGRWSVAGTRWDAEGNIALGFQAHWRADYLHAGRMLFDDFTVVSASGAELSTFVTLRTYAPATSRWEIAGLAALQPGVDGRWNGRADGAEMHLFAELRLANGRVLHNRIRFHDIEANRFLWESRDSLDDGATWTRTTSLIATRLG
jgi:hypothetical protein